MENFEYVNYFFKISINIFMSYYLKYLFPNYIKRNFKIIIESTNSYNSEVVEINYQKFKQLAQLDGMKITKVDKHIRPNNHQCSYYIYGEYNKDTWKIRNSDHNHNENYDFDDTYNIVSNDILSDNDIKNKYQEFKDIMDYDKTNIINIINNTNFVIDFVNKYQTNPTWFIKFCQNSKYNIDIKIIRTDWFKLIMKKKCEEISNKSQKFKQKYEETSLSDWSIGKRLLHF